MFFVYPCVCSVPLVLSHLPKTENKQVIDKILSVNTTNQTSDNNIEGSNQMRKKQQWEEDLGIKWMIAWFDVRLIKDQTLTHLGKKKQSPTKTVHIKQQSTNWKLTGIKFKGLIRERKTTVRKRFGWLFDLIFFWSKIRHSPWEKETDANKYSAYQTTINQLKTGMHQNQGTDLRKKDNSEKEISVLLRGMFLLLLAYQS